MDSLSEHNDHLAPADQQRLADQRAEQLIALGADRGVARGIAAMELGLVGSDRIDLDDREGRGNALTLLMTDKPGSGSRTNFAEYTPNESERMPDPLPAILPDHARRMTERGKAPQTWRP